MRVYLAGPYTQGDVALNVRNAILAGDEIIRAGHTPFIPHLTHYQHTLAPQDYEVWMRLDMDWLEVCDCLIRLPGESSGADREMLWATAHGKLVYLGVQAFICLNKLLETFESPPSNAPMPPSVPDDPPEWPDLGEWVLD